MFQTKVVQKIKKACS